MNAMEPSTKFPWQQNAEIQGLYPDRENNRADRSNNFIGSSNFVKNNTGIEDLKAPFEARKSRDFDKFITSYNFQNYPSIDHTKSSIFHTSGDVSRVRSLANIRPIANHSLTLSNKSSDGFDFDLEKFTTDFNFHKAPKNDMTLPLTDTSYDHDAMPVTNSNEPRDLYKTQTSLHEKMGNDFSNIEESCVNKSSMDDAKNDQDSNKNRDVLALNQTVNNNDCVNDTMYDDEDRSVISTQTYELLNPLSDDYLDKLDAHLLDTISIPARTDDRWTQTPCQSIVEKRPTEFRVRSLSLEPKKSKRQTIKRRPRSSSVSRSTRKYRQTCHDPDLDNDFGEQIQSSTRSNIKNVKDKIKKTSMKEKNTHHSDRRISNDAITFDRTVFGVECSLDKCQKESLQELFHDLTKEEGRILMDTVSSILKNRFVKKRVVFNEKSEVFSQKNCRNKKKTSSLTWNKTHDDKLCDEYIQTYCYGGSFSPSTSGSESRSPVRSDDDKIASCLSPHTSPDECRCKRNCYTCGLTDGNKTNTSDYYSKKKELKQKQRKRNVSTCANKCTRQTRQDLDSHRFSKSNSKLQRGNFYCEACQNKEKRQDDCESVSQRRHGHHGNSTNRRKANNKKESKIYSQNTDDKVFKENFRGKLTTAITESNYRTSLLNDKDETDKGIVNDDNFSSCQGDKNRIRTPTPSPPIEKSFVPAKARIKSSEEQTERDTLNVPRSFNSLKVVDEDKNSNINLDNLTFDVTSRGSDVSLSQKISELNLSKDCDCNNEELFLKSDDLLQLSKGNQDKNDITAFQDGDGGANDFGNFRDYINSDENIKHEMMININRNTQTLLQKATDQLENADRFLESIKHNHSIVLPVKEQYAAVQSGKMATTDRSNSNVSLLELQTMNSTLCVQDILPSHMKIISNSQRTTECTTGDIDPDKFTMKKESDIIHKRSSLEEKLSPLGSRFLPFPILNVSTMTKLNSPCHVLNPAMKAVTQGQKQLSALYNQQTAVQTNSSGSLTTTSQDSTLISLDTSGSVSCVEVSNLDETFSIQQDECRHRLAKLQTKESLSTEKSIENKNESQVQQQILVKTYDATTAVPVRTSFCSVESDAKSCTNNNSFWWANRSFRSKSIIQTPPISNTKIIHKDKSNGEQTSFYGTPKSTVLTNHGRIGQSKESTRKLLKDEQCDMQAKVPKCVPKQTNLKIPSKIPNKFEKNFSRRILSSRQQRTCRSPTRIKTSETKILKKPPFRV